LIPDSYLGESEMGKRIGATQQLTVMKKKEQTFNSSLLISTGSEVHEVIKEEISVEDFLRLEYLLLRISEKLYARIVSQSRQTQVVIMNSLKRALDRLRIGRSPIQLFSLWKANSLSLENTVFNSIKQLSDQEFIVLGDTLIYLRVLPCEEFGDEQLKLTHFGSKYVKTMRKFVKQDRTNIPDTLYLASQLIRAEDNATDAPLDGPIIMGVRS
jgi:hypothetical protein